MVIGTADESHRQRENVGTISKSKWKLWSCELSKIDLYTFQAGHAFIYGWLYVYKYKI